MADKSDDDDIQNELSRIPQNPVGEEQRPGASAPVNVPKTVIPRSSNYTKINNSAFSSLGPKKNLGGSKRQRKSKKSRKSRKIKKFRKYKSRRR